MVLVNPWFARAALDHSAAIHADDDANPVRSRFWWSAVDLSWPACCHHSPAVIVTSFFCRGRTGIVTTIV
eukprot:3260260-Rhodomonas_salina.3